MILLDIINNINNNLTSNDNCSDNDNNNNIVLKFANKYENYDNIIKGIIEKPLQLNEIIEIKCSICCFLGSGSYGQVYKIKINKKYYALKISENEIPINLKMRYESLINTEKIQKYIIDVYIAGNIKCGKNQYFSIMEYGGKSLKTKIPLENIDGLDFVLRQLYNMVYLINKCRLILTDFKLNNIVINHEYRLKLIDLYIDCKSYSPCKECRIVKTYSTIEIDKIKNILDDNNYRHTYHLIPLAIGLIDLLCKKSASSIITNLGYKHGLNLGIKHMLPLIQIACYNHTHKSNSSIKEYEQVYIIKKKIEKKYPDIKEPFFYENLMNSIEVRDIYKSKFPTKKIQYILHCLFSACPDDRSIEPLKKLLNEK